MRAPLRSLPRPARPYLPRSLGGRVTLSVMAFVAAVLVLLFAGVDLALGARLDAEARTRLTDRVALARQIGTTLDEQDLVDRLRGDGVTAQLCTAASTGCVVSAATPDRPAGRGVGGTGGRPGRVGPPPRPADQSAATVRSAGSVLFTRTTLDSGAELTLSTDTTQIGATLRQLIVFEVTGGLVALGVVALVLQRLSRVALRPLDRMTGLARQITAGDRGRRLGTGDDGSELGRTALAFDGMLEELETFANRARAAESRMRDFLGDASHELRTPLAGIAANAENVLRSPTSREATERAALAVVRETRRAARLVESLLDVARLDRGSELDTSDVDLVALARHELDRTRALAPGLDVRMISPNALVVRADAFRLAQVLANLTDNARQAVGPAGSVLVTVTRGPGTATVTVVDDGPGIAAPDRERVFERFTRLDSSRSRRTGGVGRVPACALTSRPTGARAQLPEPGPQLSLPTRARPCAAGTRGGRRPRRPRHRPGSSGLRRRSGSRRPSPRGPHHRRSRRRPSPSATSPAPPW